MADDEANGKKAQQNQRQAAMAVLAHADASDIACYLDSIAWPAHENLREPENGLVMVRGRTGGDGAPFNLGEATVSRAAVRLSTGEVGFGYTLGRDGNKARMIALCDALIQTADHADTIEAKVLLPLRAAMIAERSPQGSGDRGDAGRFLHAGARGGLKR
jgi:alpha-D-ribose 1-methylphosphonate 5-triphosphate synthase subunit PhnG